MIIREVPVGARAKIKTDLNGNTLYTDMYASSSMVILKGAYVDIASKQEFPDGTMGYTVTLHEDNKLNDFIKESTSYFWTLDMLEEISQLSIIPDIEGLRSVIVLKG